ncbi:MAG TPA: hypothetical protein VMM12_00315 [Longimicrobiales bacterium]|nr:hypothetical protein [Longimicrobiales bacterium]
MRRFLAPGLTILLLTTGCGHRPQGPAPVLPDVVAIFDIPDPGAGPEAEVLRTAQPSAITYVILDPSKHGDLISSLDLAVGTAPAGGPDRAALLQRIEARLEPESRSRAMVGAGAVIRTYVFYRAESLQPTLEHTETSRKSRLETDALVLARLLPMLRMDVTERAPSLSLAVGEYRLKEERANLSITARLDSIAKSEGNDPTAQAANAHTITLITGGPEHFFLSANAGSSDALGSRYNTEAMRYEPERPASFYLGANYAVRDLEKKPGNIFQGLYFGALVEADRRPMDQFALLVGTRGNLPLLDRIVVFDVVSPFAGLVWVKRDRLVNGEVERYYGRGEFIWGLSLNLASAVDWLEQE